MLLRRSRRAIAGAVCCVALATACSDASRAQPPSPSPTPSAPSPSPRPTPEPPAPVDGDVHYTTRRLGAAGTLLHSPGSTADQPPAVDEPAVHAFIGQVDRWLDAHLTALQDGDVPGLPLDPAAAPAAAAATTTDLTGPSLAVTSARYDADVAIDGGPRWAHVRVTVERVDGTSATAEFVFTATPDGPELVAAGPAGAVAP